MYAWRKVDTRVVLSIKRTFRRVCVCFHGQLMQKKVLVRCTLYNEKFQQQPLSFMNVSKGEKTVFFLAVYSSEVGEFQNCYVTKLKCCLFSIYQIELIKFLRAVTLFLFTLIFRIVLHAYQTLRMVFTWLPQFDLTRQLTDFLDREGMEKYGFLSSSQGISLK